MNHIEPDLLIAAWRRVCLPRRACLPAVGTNRLDDSVRASSCLCLCFVRAPRHSAAAPAAHGTVAARSARSSSSARAHGVLACAGSLRLSLCARWLRWQPHAATPRHRSACGPPAVGCQSRRDETRRTVASRRSSDPRAESSHYRCIVHLASCVLRLASCVLRPAPCLQRPWYSRTVHDALRGSDHQHDASPVRSAGVGDFAKESCSSTARTNRAARPVGCAASRPPVFGRTSRRHFGTTRTRGEPSHETLETASLPGRKRAVDGVTTKPRLLTALAHILLPCTSGLLNNPL
jgi:hypothetical protein